MERFGIWTVSFIVFVLFHLSVCQVRFSSTYNGRKVTGILGSSVNFTWVFSGEVEKVELAKFIGGTPKWMIYKKKNGGAVETPLNSGRVSVLWNGSNPGRVIFTLRLTHMIDGGRYRGSISSLHSVTQYDEVRLIVLAAPRITLFSSIQNYTEGFLVNISCEASGNPPPDVEWVGNTKVKSSGKEAAFLVFRSINRTDEGDYICRANNSVDVSSLQTTVVVYYKPEGVTLTTNAPHNTVTEGETVKLTCKVTEAKPQVSLYKFFSPYRLISNSSNSEYTIYNVNRSQNYGEYRCVPQNVAGDGQEARAILNISVPAQFTLLPQNITVNASTRISLTCNASGFPSPYTRWEKSGKILSHMKQFSIPSSNRSDAGEYMCTVGNGFGEEKTARSYVTVQCESVLQHVINISY